MIHSSGKKVRIDNNSQHKLMLILCIVCVSSLMIQEIKRIIKDSEVMKYDGEIVASDLD